MVRADIEVVMHMNLEEAITLRDRLEYLEADDPTTPHYQALNEQIRKAQKLAAA